jgi:RNA polymerase sigma-70 factor (ECF subfamily)
MRFPISGRSPPVGDSEEEPLSTTEDLLPRCRNGDEAAWRELVSLYTRKVFGLAYRFTGRADEAEDLTQEIFIKVYRTLDRYREADGAFPGWLMTVARNHAIDNYRRRRQDLLRRAEDPRILENAPAREEHPLDGLERKERARLVHRGLRALPSDLRLPLILCDLQGLPYDEIAESLQLPLGTVKSRINRARLELAKRLRGRRDELVGST